MPYKRCQQKCGIAKGKSIQSSNQGRFGGRVDLERWIWGFGLADKKWIFSAGSNNVKMQTRKAGSMNSYKLVHQSDWRRILQGSAWVLVSSWGKSLTLSKIKIFLIWALRGSEYVPSLKCCLPQARGQKQTRLLVWNIKALLRMAVRLSWAQLSWEWAQLVLVRGGGSERVWWKGGGDLAMVSLKACLSFL